MDFKPGDQCVVTGDSQHWQHHFPAGTEVELLVQDSATSAWECEANKSYDGSLSWWVKPEDLMRLGEEVTEAEVLQLFGITPAPHCTTCTCHKN